MPRRPRNHPSPRRSVPRRRPVAPGRRRHPAHLVTVLGLTLSLVALLTTAGCGGDDVTSTPTSTTTPTTTATTAAPTTTAATSSTTTTAAPTDDEAEVRAVIDRYWDAWFTAAGNPPDPTNADLNAVLTGEAQVMIIGGIERRLTEGTYIRLPEPSRFERTIESVTIDERGIATVDECIVDDGQIVELSSGRVVDDRVLTLRLSSTLNRFPPDGWKITTSSISRQTEGAIPCDA